MNLNIAICDDDNFALNDEREVINAVLDEKNIAHTISCFNTTYKLLQSGCNYDIIFLDIEMDISGIELAKKIREINADCLIFFVTNYERYLDDAFNQHAFRFWTKPIDRHKLIYGIDSALKEIEDTSRFIHIDVGNSKIKIKVKNIIYIFTQNKKVHIVTTKGEIITNNTYKGIGEQLKQYTYFSEPHRGYYVNFKYIKNYNKDTIFCTYKNNTYEVYLSRRKYDSFNKRFIAWLGGEE